MDAARQLIPDLSREEELILCCARVHMTAPTRERFHQLLPGPLNWKRIAEIATLHRLRPLLYKHFKAEGKFDVIPSEHATSFQQHAAFTVGRNLSLTTELIKILKLLRNAGIEAIPFKGPVLAMRNYGNLALREFYDMDLLVHREDISKARDLLLANGFVAPESQSANWASHVVTQLGCDFTSADGKVRLELHWSFIQKWLTYDVDVDSIWKRAIPWNLAGFPVRIIPREDLLLYLCAHGAKHHWERLFWIIDIAEIIRTERDLNWREVEERARMQGSFRLLALGLYLAQSLLQAPLPDHVTAAFSEIESPARQVGSWLFHENKRVVSGDWNETKFYLSVKERWPDRLTYSKHLLKLFLAASDKDRAFMKLPRGLGFLYPAIRPVRWVVDRLHLRSKTAPQTVLGDNARDEEI